MMCALHAQVVEKDEPALVYYSPKTTVALDFTYDVTCYEAGLYAAYAEDLIGATNAVKETKNLYTLGTVRIGTRTNADYDRPHKVTPEAGVPMLLSINEKNLLVGYNVPFEPKDKNANPSSPKHKEKPSRSMDVAPLPEEVLTAGNTLAQAHAVAKQIFHLRETRSYLLNGEVEHAPADGKSMELVLAELDKQEKALTELFVGKKYKKTKHKAVYVEPEKAEKLLFFSEENGFTDAENIDADTIKVTLTIEKQQFAAPAEEKKKKNAPAITQIVYNLPGHSSVNVTYQGRCLAHRIIDVAQFGIDVPVSKDLFTGNSLPKIVFSEKTGNIISISK